jgi:hypothetical protein
MGKRSRRREVKSDLSDRDALRIVVAASPGGELSVRREVDLAKAALLYGDKAVLLSPATTLVAGVEPLANLSLEEQLRFINKVAPYFVDGRDLKSLQSTVAQIEQGLARNRDAPGFKLIRSQLSELLRPHFAPMAETIRRVFTESGVDELALARKRHLVEIDRTDSRDTVDFVAACVISAKLAATGETRGNPELSRIVTSFVQKLSTHLSSGNEYLVFDDAIGRLVDAAVAESVFQPAVGPKGRSTQAMTAASFMARLPTFPDATVDEILDIREELRGPVSKFRAAMVTMSHSFVVDPWEQGFNDELRDAWIETVEPAIVDIDEAVRQNRSLISRADGVTGALNASYPGLMIVTAGLVGHASQATIAGAAISAASPVLKALHDYRASTTELRSRPFYFLYGLKESL